MPNRNIDYLAYNGTNGTLAKINLNELVTNEKLNFDISHSQSAALVSGFSSIVSWWWFARWSFSNSSHMVVPSQHYNIIHNISDFIRKYTKVSKKDTYLEAHTSVK